MRFSVLPFALTSAVFLSACVGGGTPAPDYESWRTAWPYDGTTPVAAAPVAPQVMAEPIAQTVAQPMVQPMAQPVVQPMTPPAPTGATTTTRMLFATSRKGGTARVNGETVMVKRTGKATSGAVTYIVFFQGKNGAPTAFPAAEQAATATELVAGMTGCRIAGPAVSGAGDVLDAIGGVPKARFNVPTQC